MPILENSIDATYRAMREKLIEVVPDCELRYKAELVYEINRIKVERNTLILGHNYMEPALYHTIPDHVGDSLELCRVAATSSADTIIFCGVRFMAETAKILSPDKTVLVPSPDAGCSLAASITAADVRHLKSRYPGVPVVCYINTYADVKAECDACCTSGNAAAVVESFDTDTVIFIPDEYLARNVAKETGKKIIISKSGTTSDFVEPNSGCESGSTVVGWNGRCEVHERFSVSDVEDVRRQFSDVVVLAHPECPPDVVAASDFSGSTSAMIRHVQQTKASRYLLLTECAMGDNVAADNPDKEMLRLCSIRCPHMNEITLEQTLESLKLNRYAVSIPESVAVRARSALERMLATSNTPSHVST